MAALLDKLASKAVKDTPGGGRVGVRLAVAAGLAIADRAARRDHGRFHLRKRDEGGLLLTVVLSGAAA